MKPFTFTMYSITLELTLSPLVKKISTFWSQLTRHTSFLAHVCSFIDKDIDSSFMPEMKDSKYCPVTSYLSYNISLNHDSDWMWQQPNFHTFPSDPKVRVYYRKNRVGQNTMDTFISTLANKCGINDEGYTNHCLRVTGINILTSYFKRKEVRAVSGHKSDESLSI